MTVISQEVVRDADMVSKCRHDMIVRQIDVGLVVRTMYSASAELRVTADWSLIPKHRQTTMFLGKGQRRLEDGVDV